MQKTLIVIAGPTAVGKTALGIEIAKHFKTEIISADSRQFFKEMSIGTAKPDEKELQEIKHHFINSHSIQEDVSVGSYEKQVLKLLEKLFSIYDVVVMVGGSGLYINAVIKGFDDLPETKNEIREQLNKKLQEEGLKTLQKELERVDLNYYNEVDINNPQRIIRALEIYHTTGNPFSHYRKGVKKQRLFKTIIIGLNTEREKLYNRINKRVDQMISSGLVDEVKTLYTFRQLNSLNTVGYSEIFEYLDANISLEQAIESIKQNTRRFAKRQITWFKKLENIVWFDPNQKQEILDYLNNQVSKSQLDDN